MSTTFTNDFCACQLSAFTEILPLHSLQFRHFLMAAWQQWMLDSDSEPDLDVFLTEDFGENEHFAAALGSGSDVD